MLAGCSQENKDQTRADAKKLGQDLKRDAKEADAVVTEKMKEARVKVQQETQDLKRKADKPKDQQ
jgi:hypothetical protein